MGRGGNKQSGSVERSDHALDGFACAGTEQRGHGRPPRMLDHGDLRYVLLHLISEKQSHGYELIKTIEEKFEGLYTPSPGVIYPTLTHLEELGYLRSETDVGTKRLFSITPDGIAFMATHRPLLDCILARMAAAKAIFASPPAPEIQRAVRGATAALAARLARQPLEPSQITTICDLLDRLAADLAQS